MSNFMDTWYIWAAWRDSTSEPGEAYDANGTYRAANILAAKRQFMTDKSLSPDQIIAWGGMALRQLQEHDRKLKRKEKR